MHFRTSTSRLLYGVGVNYTKSIKKLSEVFLSFMQYLQNKWRIKELGKLWHKFRHIGVLPADYLYAYLAAEVGCLLFND